MRKKKINSNNSGNKRKKDQFYVTTIGLLVYALVLLVMVTVSYIGVKKIFSYKDSIVKEKVDEEIKAREENLSQNSTFVPKDPEETVNEDEMNEHLIEPEVIISDNQIMYGNPVFCAKERDTSVVWKDKVFSKIENVKNPKEALVNTYEYARKWAILDNGHEQEFNIYMNEDSIIEKITTVEKISDKVEIIDYYYDHGSINYIAQRDAYVEMPVDISSAAVTSRYYYDEDMLIKYSYCENGKATIFKATELDNYSEGTVSQYNELEENMINKAYITYNAAINLPESQRIEGYVLDEYDSPMSEANISIADRSGKEIATVMTNGDGYYSTEIPVDNDSEYVLTASKNTLDEVKIYGVTSKKGAGVFSVPTPRLTYSNDGAEYNAQIVVRDAEYSNMPIGDATINLRNGINCKEGEPVYSGMLDETGAVMLSIQAGNYTAEVKKGGYEDAYFNVVINMNHQATIGYAVQDIKEGQYKVILSFETTPLDLDGRILTSDFADIRKSEPDSCGILSTELLTINTDEEGSLRYFVSDYTDITGGDVNSANLSKSGARVEIYNCEGYVASLNVPTGHLGVIWEPFMVRGGEIIPVNHYYNVYEPNSCFVEK